MNIVGLNLWPMRKFLIKSRLIYQQQGALLYKSARRRIIESDLLCEIPRRLPERKANVQRIGVRARQGKFGGQFIFQRREWKQLFCCLLRESASELLQNVLFVTSNLLTGKQYILFLCVCVCTTMHVHNILLVVWAALQK
jgi:hypothetical protein